jgi:hypothetical protein
MEKARRVVDSRVNLTLFFPLEKVGESNEACTCNKADPTQHSTAQRQCTGMKKKKKKEESVMHSKMNENTRGFRDVYVQALQIELGLLSHSVLVFLLDISTSYICYAFVAVDYSAALAKL